MVGGRELWGANVGGLMAINFLVYRIHYYRYRWNYYYGYDYCVPPPSTSN